MDLLGKTRAPAPGSPGEAGQTQRQQAGRLPREDRAAAGSRRGLRPTAGTQPLHGPESAAALSPIHPGRWTARPQGPPPGLVFWRRASKPLSERPESEVFCFVATQVPAAAARPAPAPRAAQARAPHPVKLHPQNAPHPGAPRAPPSAAPIRVHGSVRSRCSSRDWRAVVRAVSLHTCENKARVLWQHLARRRSGGAPLVGYVASGYNERKSQDASLSGHVLFVRICVLLM